MGFLPHVTGDAEDGFVGAEVFAVWVVPVIVEVGKQSGVSFNAVDGCDVNVAEGEAGEPVEEGCVHGFGFLDEERVDSTGNGVADVRACFE